MLMVLTGDVGEIDEVLGERLGAPRKDLLRRQLIAR
jgi:hypothetical protein